MGWDGFGLVWFIDILFFGGQVGGQVTVRFLMYVVWITNGSCFSGNAALFFFQTDGFVSDIGRGGWAW